MILPVALDTNMWVRLLVNNDAAQDKLAAVRINASPACFFRAKQ